MTRPTDQLRQEHRASRLALETFAELAAHVRRGGAFPAGDIALVLRFLREFVVATHFRKENEIVWPAIAMHGDETAATEVGALMAAQDEVVELLSSLIVFWEPSGELTDAERRGFADTVDALRLRFDRLEAMEEELFEACERQVPPDDRIDWPQRFAAVGAQRTLLDSWLPRLRRLRDDWVD